MDKGQERGISEWVPFVILFAAYFTTAKFGLTINAVGGFATFVWPPTGIALAALLMLGYRFWPGIALAAFLVNYSMGAPLLAAFGMAAGNTLEAVVGAYLLRQWVGFDNSLERLRDVLGLILFAALMSTAVSATIGVSSLTLTGVIPSSSYGLTWRAWWVGDILGDLVVAPLLLIWSGRRLRLPSSWERAAEAGLLAFSLLAINVLVFWKLPALEIRHFPISYLIFPPLIWAAIRFGQCGAITAVFVTSCVAIWGTTRGLGPFGKEMPSDSLLFLQIFTGVFSATTMIVAATVAERVKSEKRALESEESLRRAGSLLEATVYERTQELRKSNEALRVEIAERARAGDRLKKAYADLKDSHEKLESARWQLTQAEKMETVGRLAAGVAHEVKNPLSIILMGVQYLMRLPLLAQQPSKGEITPMNVLEDMRHAVQRADNVVKGLLDFAASKELHLQAEQLNPIVEQSFLLVKHALAVSLVEIAKDLREPLPQISMDRNKIEQVFVNLFMNAIHAMPQGGTLTVRTFSDGAFVTAEVEDTGTGIPPEKLSKIFDPFFTTKPTGKGTGLGLTVARHILEMHGGEIMVRNRSEGSGVRATLRFRVEKEGGDRREKETGFDRRRRGPLYASPEAQS